MLGGAQTRPNVHVDDLVDAYLFRPRSRLAGIYNVGFENLSVLDIAKAVTREVPASIDIKPSNDPRSDSICSDKFLATGFAPSERSDGRSRIAEAYRDGRLKDEPVSTMSSGCSSTTLPSGAGHPRGVS